MKNLSSVINADYPLPKKHFGDFATQQESDEEYDVEKAVPDFLEHINYFVQKSDKTRGLIENRTIISYGPTLMERITVSSRKSGRSGDAICSWRLYVSPQKRFWLQARFA